MELVPFFIPYSHLIRTLFAPCSPGYRTFYEDLPGIYRDISGKSPVVTR